MKRQEDDRIAAEARRALWRRLGGRVLFGAVLATVALSGLALTGCRGRRAAMVEEESVAVASVNAMVSGRRTEFVNGDGEVLLKVRRRRARTRVFGADRVPLGDVLRDGQTTHLLRRDHQSGYIIAPFDDDDADAGSPIGEGDQRLTLLVHEARVPLPLAVDSDTPATEPEKPVEPNKAEDAPPETSAMRLARLSRLEVRGAPVARMSMTSNPDQTTWRIYRKEDVLLAELEGPGEGAAGDWTVRVFDGEDEARGTFVLRTTDDPHDRRVLAFTEATADADPPAPVLQARDRALTAPSLAPLLIGEMEPLLRAGMIEVLSR